MNEVKMREYKITKWELGYHVFREDDWVREYLQKDTYTPNKSHAMTFYHLDSAVSALQIAKFKWEKISTTSTEKSECEGPKEKTSWSEL